MSIYMTLLSENWKIQNTLLLLSSSDIVFLQFLDYGNAVLSTLEPFFLTFYVYHIRLNFVHF